MATYIGFLAIFSWGLLALLGNLTKALPAFQLLFMCFALSFIILLVKRFASKQPLLTPPKLSKKHLIIGVTGLFGFHFCYFMALKYGPLIEVSLIVYLWPLLLGVFVATPGSKFKAILGGLLGFLGTLSLITDGSVLSINSEYYLGYFFAGCCAVLWSSYSYLMSQFDSHVDDIGWLSLIVAVLALFAHFYFETTVIRLSVSQCLGAILLGLGPVGGAFYLWDHGLKFGNRSLLASLSFLTPVLSTFILILASQAPFSWSVFIALVLILLGATISNKKPSISLKKA
ncbi:DMT family transporter [Pseudoalteromonas sp. 2CM28B]|uniref:DMT family transporter n=1 Tax=Pseudoalteromonas sp. 2CM28B TaxID=2929851 RepID=UPI0020BF8A3F|nr:EamA family transporter [Pseudoalteromonas sp. 2CM28B]MCK8134231.1 EamA family transporter [Pseudoalteromonas sp. 2CM28B]